MFKSALAVETKRQKGSEKGRAPDSYGQHQVSCGDAQNWALGRSTMAEGSMGASTATSPCWAATWWATRLWCACPRLHARPGTGGAAFASRVFALDCNLRSRATVEALGARSRVNKRHGHCQDLGSSSEEGVILFPGSFRCDCIFAGELCSCTHFILAEILVLAGGVIPPAPAVPASTRISARLKRVQKHSSPANVPSGTLLPQCGK